MRPSRPTLEKWERKSKTKSLYEVQLGRHECPLCELFNKRTNGAACKGCPVSIQTEQIYCEGTPFEKAEKAWQTDKIEMFRKAARAEVDFLKSLLPNEGE